MYHVLSYQTASLVDYDRSPLYLYMKHSEYIANQGCAVVCRPGLGKDRKALPRYHEKVLEKVSILINSPHAAALLKGDLTLKCVEQTWRISSTREKKQQADC